MSLPTHIVTPARHLQRACDAFNAAHPVGAPVLVTFGGGVEREGVIASRAHVRPPRVEVRVEFVGISGRFEISRLRSTSNLKLETSNLS